MIVAQSKAAALQRTCSILEAGGSKVQVLHCSKCKVCPTIDRMTNLVGYVAEENMKIQWCRLLIAPLQ